MAHFLQSYVRRQPCQTWSFHMLNFSTLSLTYKRGIKIQPRCLNGKVVDNVFQTWSLATLQVLPTLAIYEQKQQTNTMHRDRVNIALLKGIKIIWASEVWCGFFVVFLFFYCKTTISSAKIIWQYPASWAALAAAAPSTTLPQQTLLQDPRLFPSPSCHSLAKNRPPLALPLLPFGGRGTLQSTQGTSQPSQKMDWAANTFQV